MANLQVLSPQTFTGKRWKRFQSYRFAAGDALCPLAAQELAEAALAMPIAFEAHGDGYRPVAVMGLRPGTNHFVLPDGRWGAGYTPALYRVYPFRLASGGEQGDILCLDVDSGLVSEEEGEPFFSEGKPSPSLDAVITFFGQIRSGLSVATTACKLLHEHQLVQPWPITLQAADGERRIEGLFRIEEERLGQLEGEALKQLHRSGAMNIAYCQLLSTRHLAALGRLAGAAEQSQQAHWGASEELDLEFLNQGETLGFDGL